MYGKSSGMVALGPYLYKLMHVLAGMRRTLGKWPVGT